MSLFHWLRGRAAAATATTIKKAEEKALEKAAAAAFLALHRGEHIAWTCVAAQEQDRVVIGVFYGSTLPPRYQFFEVEPVTATARVLEADEAYRPKNWR